MKRWRLVISIIIPLGVIIACSPSEPLTAKSVVEDGGVASYGIGEKADNLIKMFAFIDKVKNGEKAMIRIANFWESKTFIDDMTFDGQKLKWTERTTPEDIGATTICKEISDDGNGYFGLHGCQGKHTDVGVLMAQRYFYDKAKKEFEGK